MGKRDERWGGVYTCCVLRLHLGMEGGWMDVYGALETERGPLPLLSHVESPHMCTCRHCYPHFDDEEMKTQNA